jgi:phage-related minor tail protein
MKSLITQATEALYSELFDFDKVLEKLSSKAGKLEVLIAIKLAASLNSPLTKNDIKEAMSELISSKADLEDNSEMNIFLNLLQESTELDWLEKTKRILKGKLAYKQNQYSYEASIYHLEKTKKRPASTNERAKWATLSENLEQAQKNYDDHIQKLKFIEQEDSTKKAQAVLDQMIKERDERRKNMTDAEIENEIKMARVQREEILKDIKAKLQKPKND